MNTVVASVTPVNPISVIKFYGATMYVANEFTGLYIPQILAAEGRKSFASDFHAGKDCQLILQSRTKPELRFRFSWRSADAILEVARVDESDAVVPLAPDAVHNPKVWERPGARIDESAGHATFDFKQAA